MTHSEIARTLTYLQSTGAISAGWEVKDAVFNLAAGESVTESQMATALRESNAAELAKSVREDARLSLQEQWSNLPAWIRGPYRPLFDAANSLLDEGDDEAAFEMIDSAEPMAAILNDTDIYASLGGLTKADFFNTVKSQFRQAIQTL